MSLAQPVDNSAHLASNEVALSGSLAVKTPTSSRPGRRSQRRPGLADQKDTDRLMSIMPCPRGGRP